MRPETMRAMVLTGFGGYDTLHYRPDVPVPKPADDEVLVEVAACGVNNTDIWTREGAYGTDENSGWRGGAFEFPRIQGADIVGRIVDVGGNVPRERLGARVMVNPTLYAGAGDGLFEAAFIGSERDGGFAEFACVPDANAHAIDSPLSDPELATFMTAYLTAEHMLNRAEVSHRRNGPDHRGLGRRRFGPGSTGSPAWRARHRRHRPGQGGTSGRPWRARHCFQRHGELPGGHSKAASVRHGGRCRRHRRRQPRTAPARTSPNGRTVRYSGCHRRADGND